jgi:hypothetical protein
MLVHGGLDQRKGVSVVSKRRHTPEQVINMLREAQVELTKTR